MSSFTARYEAVRRQVADAADLAGRDPDGVTVVAVTKTVGIEAVREALFAGVCDFGENRVQEFLGKWGLFPDARWHFIGTLQTNKVKDVVGRACLIHSVDSGHLLRAISRRAEQIDAVQPVLLQVNVSGEATKHGFAPADVESVLAAAAQFPGVVIRGFMTMAPFGPPEGARPVFAALRELRDSCEGRRHHGVELAELSMGMSGDYAVAIEEGSTIVRVGRALFDR